MIFLLPLFSFGIFLILHHRSFKHPYVTYVAYLLLCSCLSLVWLFTAGYAGHRLTLRTPDPVILYSHVVKNQGIYTLVQTPDGPRLLLYPYTNESAKKAQEGNNLGSKNITTRLHPSGSYFSDGGPFYAHELPTPEEPKP